MVAWVSIRLSSSGSYSLPLVSGGEMGEGEGGSRSGKGGEVFSGPVTTVSRGLEVAMSCWWVGFRVGGLVPTGLRGLEVAMFR
jgi:hypothetical protein